jgi:hypothetical protein
MRLAIGALRWSRPIRQGERVVLEYTADLVPMALMSPPLPSPSQSTGRPRSCAGTCPYSASVSPFADGAAFGAGASPFGIAAAFRAGQRVQPTLAATGGLLWFDRRVPTGRAARVNAAVTAEAGIRVAATERVALTLTYRLHHISNAGLARENFALASNLVSLGVRWRRGPLASGGHRLRAESSDRLRSQRQGRTRSPVSR